MKIDNRVSRSGLRNRKGAMLVFVAVAMVGLLGMLALTLDVGAGNRQRRIAQTAADAGALGGGTQIYRNLDSASVVAAALSSAALNGFPVENVTVNYPPSAGRAGTFAGDKQYVEVIINKNIPSIFGSLFRVNSLDVQAWAVAGTGAFSTYCMIGWGPGTNIDVSGDVTANCSIGSNGSIDVKKGITAPSVTAVGSVQGGPGGGATRTGTPPIVDPFDALALPINGDTICTVTNLPEITKDTTISPGVYCGTGANPRGIAVHKNITVTMNPGTYFIRGGGLSGGEISATGGVTIINAVGANGDVSVFRPITFENSCLAQITAPTAGTYKGIAIFVDRRAPSSGSNSINMFCGNGDINGVIYMPTQEFQLVNSNGKLTITGTLLAGKITTENGGGKFFLTLDTTGNSAPKRLSLVK